MFEISEIEQQHRELIGMLNKLSAAVQDNEPLEKIELIIDTVIDYTRFHFAVEERFMAQYGYPELEGHIEKHRQLMRDILRFKEKLRLIGEQQFSEWLHHWPFAYIQAHITYADQQVEDYIAKYGLGNHQP